MKILLSSLLLASSAIVSQAHKPDTLVNVNNAKQVIVVQNDSVVDIQILGLSDHPNYHLKHRFFNRGNSLIESAASKWDFSLPSLTIAKNKVSKSRKGKHQDSRLSLTFIPTLFLGMSSPMSNEFPSRGENNWDIDLQLFRFCFDFNRRHHLSLGWGYGWGKQVMNSHHYLQLNKDVLSVGDYPQGAYAGRSVARYNRWSWLLAYRYRIDKDWRIWAGLQANSHMRPRIYNSYREAEKNISITHENEVRLRTYSLSFLSGLSYKGLGFYAKYSPQSAFEQGYGPQFSSFTLGLSFNIF